MNFPVARWSADSLFPLFDGRADSSYLSVSAQLSARAFLWNSWSDRLGLVKPGASRRTAAGWPGDRTVPERQIAFLFATKAEENRAAAASGRPKVRAVYLVRQSKQVLSALSPSLSSLTSKVVDRPTDRLEERPMELCAPGRPTPRESAAQHVE